jgi:hypothetical protein
VHAADTIYRTPHTCCERRGPAVRNTVGFLGEGAETPRRHRDSDPGTSATSVTARKCPASSREILRRSRRDPGVPRSDFRALPALQPAEPRKTWRGSPGLIRQGRRDRQGAKRLWTHTPGAGEFSVCVKYTKSGSWSLLLRCWYWLGVKPEPFRSRKGVRWVPSGSAV